MNTKKILFQVLFALANISATFALDVPNPTSPADGLERAYTRQQFYWALVDDAGAYELQIDTTLEFNSPLLIEKRFTSNSSQIVYGMHYNTHYYWRMRSVSKLDNDVVSDWCDVRELTTLARPNLESIIDSSATGNYYPNQTFTWKSNYGSTQYVLEIDTVETFDSPAKVRKTYSVSQSTSDTYYSQTVGDLYLGCFNYWRVKAYNDNDSSEWSKVGLFHTLKTAKITSPADLTSAYTQQTFYWTYQRGLNNVIIEIDTTNTFTSPALRRITDSGSSQDYCTSIVNYLYFGKTHYWRLKSYHNRDTTEWSNVLSFKTYNFCNLSTPSDSATNRFVSGKLTWNYSKGVNHYQVQMDTVSTFDSPALIDKIESASSNDYAYYSYSNLYFGKNYYWRVRECHALDTSRWSVTRCFSTYRHCTLKANPADSATNVATSPSLYFDYTTGISKYQMQLDTTPEFNSPLLESHIESASSSSYAYHTYTDLLFGQRYYRRVRECHSNDTSDWSPICTFTTIAKGAYSTNSSYASITKGATNVSRTPKLYYAYRSYIDYCEIQLDTTLNFNSPLFESHKEKEASSQTYAYITPNSTLLAGTVYYWRIRDIHSKDISDWTTPRWFVTVGCTPVPTLIAPEDQTIAFYDKETDFSWKGYDGALAYVLQISDSEKFDSIHYEKQVTDTTTSVLLPENSTYFWRVQAIVDLGRTKWSNAWVLTTKDSTALYTLDTPVLVSPADSIERAYTRQYFRWEEVADAGKYVLQIDTAKGFNSPALIEKEYTTNVDNVIYDFHYNTKYYWRVCAYSATNVMERSHWSQVFQFTTTKAPVLVSPNDSSETSNFYLTQTLCWKNSRGTTSYAIELDTVETFDSPAKERHIYNTSATNTDEKIEYGVSDLYIGRMIYWRVKAYNENDSSQWSDVYRFHTLNKAEGTAPINLTSAYTSLTFRWKYYRGLPKVIIELDTVPDFSSDALRTINSWAYNEDDAYENVSNLNFGTTYYWRVCCYHQRDTTRWSPTYTFKTYDYCALSSPSTGATSLLTTGSVYWKWSKGVSYYQVQLDTVPTFDSPELESSIVWDSENGDHSYQYKNYFFGTTYYWRVRECLPNDTTAWSEVRYFTTYARGLQGNTPADGATDVTVTPSLYIDYSNGINTYFVQIDTAQTFDSELLREQKVTASSSSYAYWHVESPLRYGTTYYWRVCDAHVRDTSDWSFARSFVTAALLPEPIPVTPADQTELVENTPVVFNWSASDGATHYIFQIAYDAEFDSIAHQETLSGTSTSMVLPVGTYYWRVVAVDAEGMSLWSDALSIIITPGTTTALDSIGCDAQKPRKVIREGVVYIIVGDKIYNLLGIEQHIDL